MPKSIIAGLKGMLLGAAILGIVSWVIDTDRFKTETRTNQKWIMDMLKEISLWNPTK